MGARLFISMFPYDPPKGMVGKIVSFSVQRYQVLDNIHVSKT